jgi:hypothetical protein
MPTAIEIENGNKVVEMLSLIPDVSFRQEREDMFVVSEPESELDVYIDVEKTTIIFMIEICSNVESLSQELGQYMATVNNKMAVHGSYGYDPESKKIIFKDVLEIQNLDQNELEASIISMILTVANTIKKISGLL